MQTLFRLLFLKPMLKIIYNLGHDHLLKIHLLEKSAQHDFSFARHHSSKCHFFCQLLENQKSSAVRVFRAVSLLDKKILTAQIAIG
jgi:hypothetical protein